MPIRKDGRTCLTPTTSCRTISLCCSFCVNGETPLTPASDCSCRLYRPINSLCVFPSRPSDPNITVCACRSKSCSQRCLLWAASLEIASKASNWDRPISIPWLSRRTSSRATSSCCAVACESISRRWRGFRTYWLLPFSLAPLCPRGAHAAAPQEAFPPAVDVVDEGPAAAAGASWSKDRQPFDSERSPPPPSLKLAGPPKGPGGSLDTGNGKDAACTDTADPKP